MILCNFENDFCHRERQPESADSQYAWFRNTSNDLESAGLQGPSQDHNAEKDKFFAIASGMLPPDSPQDATAALISPYLVASVHPKECFGFWIYFAVSFL